MARLEELQLLDAVLPEGDIQLRLVRHSHLLFWCSQSHFRYTSGQLDC